MKIEYQDIIATLLIVGAFVAKCLGYNHIIDEIIVGISAFYLGLKINIPQENGNKTQESQVK